MARQCEPTHSATLPRRSPRRPRPWRAPGPLSARSGDASPIGLRNRGNSLLPTHPSCPTTHAP
eukprot:2600745-Pyramimonas_sp.AAC.1